MYNLDELVAILTVYFDAENVLKSSQQYYDEINTSSYWSNPSVLSLYYI